MTQEMGLTAQPLDFNPPPMVQSVRAAARHTRLLEAQETGQEVDPAEIERYREQAYGKVSHE